MSIIPAGALPRNQVTIVPNRLLREVAGLLNLEDNAELISEIQGYLNPPDAKYRKKR